jgi:hypothetical protein
MKITPERGFPWNEIGLKDLQTLIPDWSNQTLRVTFDRPIIFLTLFPWTDINIVIYEYTIGSLL